MTHRNDLLDEVLPLILESNLGGAIDRTQKYINENGIGMLAERFDEIRENYSLIRDYMLKGYVDSSREEVCQQLLSRLYNLVCDIEKYRRTQELGLFAGAHKRGYRHVWQHEDICKELENYVQDYAMLSLEPEAIREQKSFELLDKHYKAINELFDMVFTSPQWKSTDSDFYSQLLASPTIDINDAQVLVSAIMLSGINYFDFYKFKALLEIYLNAVDEEIRQRALVGWVIVLQHDMGKLFPIQQQLDRVLKSDDVMNELQELQRQMFFCAEAEKDNDEIQKDIMPNLMKNNNFKVTRFGLEEKEDNEMEDILHPDASDKKMEEMEKGIQQMMDMQKQGSDIYFGGFAQMKRFPFFSITCNWFMPFFGDHPGLARAREKLKDTKLLPSLTATGPFCDSDKYSFVIALETVIDQFPANVREVLGSSKIVNPLMTSNEKKSGAYIRRMYLQNVYRFFKLNFDRHEFVNMFNMVESDGKGFFMQTLSDYLYTENALKPLMGLAQFLLKHGYTGHALRILESLSIEDNAEFTKLYATTMARRGFYDEAANLFMDIIDDDTEDEQLLNSAAEAYFKVGKALNAAELYLRLKKLKPESKKYALNAAVAYVEAGDVVAASPILAELDFRYPDDLFVLRTRAWAYLCQGKPVEAEQLYMKVINAGNLLAADYLNCGYALWFQNKIMDAVMMFKNYVSMADGIDLQKTFRADEQVFKKNKISETDIFLMVDLVSK